MKRKHSNPPTARVKNPLAKVTITEIPPTANQFLQLYSPAQMAQLLERHAQLETRVRENRRRAVEEHQNESRRQNAQRKKQIAFTIANRLIQQDRSLGLGTRSELARRIRTQWRDRTSAPAVRSIRRWLNDKI
jgi:hypothetical protein